MRSFLPRSEPTNVYSRWVEMKWRCSLLVQAIICRDLYVRRKRYDPIPSATSFLCASVNLMGSLLDKAKLNLTRA